MHAVTALLFSAASLGGLYLAANHFNVSTSPGDDVFKREWELYLARYGKQYSDAEKAARFPIFKANYIFVASENAKGHSYDLAVNEFADMSDDEFAQTHGGINKPEKLWGDLKHLGTHLFSGAVLPSAVDWTTKGAVTPVKNQGSCGSCWAFSTTGSLEGAYEIATGKKVSLSEQQLVDCSSRFGNKGCQGGLMDNGFKYAEQTNMCTEESYKYMAKVGTCQASSCTTGLPKGSVTGFKDVPAENTNALMEAVAQQPVSVAIEADQKTFQLYKGGVLKAQCGNRLDHGVLIVGFGTMNGVDYWKVKNSWGPSWGMDGYVLLERGLSGPGECGIKMQPSYPVVKGGPGPGPAPGPSPPPSPPSPPSPPVPPSPSTTHYEKPPCQADEVAASIQGANGAVCAPHCDSSPCPTDTPPGTLAKPQCALQDSSSGSKYCALICLRDAGCPKGATCAKVQGPLGVCVYPEDRVEGPTTVMEFRHLSLVPKDTSLVV